MIGGRAQSARMRRPRAVRAASKGEKPTVSTVTDEDDPSDGDGARIVPPFSREQFEGLKRKDLQALCKVHNIKSSGKNAELVEKLLEIGADHSREGTSVGETCPAADPEKATPRKVSDVLAESGSSGRRASSVSLKVVPAKIGTPRTPSRALTSVDRRTPARSISTPRTTTRTGKSVATPTAAVVIDASAETALKAFTKENQPSLNTPEDKPKSGNLIKGTIPPASISQLPVTKRAKVTVTLGKTASDVKPPSAITLSGGKASSAVPPTTAPVKKKFDLKESLRRPLNYKPHTGPLKPFSLL